MASYHYELSLAAESDLEEIYDYTCDRFGVDQALVYLGGLDELFASICAQPQLGRSRDEVRDGVRSISYVSHVVFYRVMIGRIRIVRVLHASRDIHRFL